MSGLKKAIDAKRGNTFFLEPEKLLIIGSDTKHKRGEHPLYQERAKLPVSETLALSMSENDFTSVVDVRVDGPNTEVTAGRQRVKAARLANLIRAELRGEETGDKMAVRLAKQISDKHKAAGTVPSKLGTIMVECKVRRGKDYEVRAVAMSENAHRQNVNPMEMAEEIQDFVSLGRSEGDAAILCGKTVQQVRDLLRLLDLDESLQDAVRSTEISAGAAIHFADLTRSEQKAELAKMRASGQTATVTATARVVRARKRGEEEVVQAPGKRLLTKLLAHEDADNVFGEDGIKAIRYVLGDLSPRGITGLSDLIRQAKGE